MSAHDYSFMVISELIIKIIDRGQYITEKTVTVEIPHDYWNVKEICKFLILIVLNINYCYLNFIYNII